MIDAALFAANLNQQQYSSDLMSNKEKRCNKYMLSGCELIDTENISLPSQNMKLLASERSIVEEASTATSFLQSDLSQQQVCAQLSVHAVIGHS
jgi:hypothetical protein